MRVDVEQATVPAIYSVDSAVELAIGERTALAGSLSDYGVSMTATDIVPRNVPTGVTFIIDDLTNPTHQIYEAADVLFACRLPEELHQPAATLSAGVEVPLYFTTLGFEEPSIPVDRISTPVSTWYRARIGNSNPTPT